MADNPQAGTSPATGTAERAHAANEKAVAETRAAAAGAHAVIDGIRRVTDAFIAEISKAKSGPTEWLDFDATGSAGGRFIIDGPPNSFGASGTVKMGNVQLHTREWSAMRIVGDLPAGTKSGEVTVYLDANTTKRGYLTVA